MGWLDGTYTITTPRRLASKEERARQDRMAQHRAKWRRAEKARADWTPEQFDTEETRLQAEIAALLAQRDAPKDAEKAA